MKNPGNLITVMKANDQYATSRIEIKNSQDVFIKSQKTSQKFVIGIPLILIIGVFLINPSFLEDIMPLQPVKGLRSFVSQF